MPKLNEGPTGAGLAALAGAARYLGARETHGSNRSPLIDRWNTYAGVPVGSPYCATFQHWVWNELADVDLGGNYWAADSYCPSLLAWGRKLGYERARPYAGYVVLFDFDEDGTMDHVGIVEKVIGLRWTAKNGTRRFVGLIRAIEANTSSGIRGSQADGDGVHRRTRWVNASTRFLRVPGPKDRP